MTKIQIKKTGDTYTITAKGHADYNPGNDPICAAISMLLLTLAQVAEDLSGNNAAIISKMTLKPGKVAITVESNTTDWEYAVKTITTGFELLEHQYPQNVLLINRVGEQKKRM